MHDEDHPKDAVIKQNFSDACLASCNSICYAFGTEDVTLNINVRLASASDPANWKVHKCYHALPVLRSWVLNGSDARICASEVAQRVCPHLPLC